MAFDGQAQNWEKQLKTLFRETPKYKLGTVQHILRHPELWCQNHMSNCGPIGIQHCLLGAIMKKHGFSSIHNGDFQNSPELMYDTVDVMHAIQRKYPKYGGYDPIRTVIKFNDDIHRTYNEVMEVVKTAGV